MAEPMARQNLQMSNEYKQNAHKPFVQAGSGRVKRRMWQPKKNLPGNVDHRRRPPTHGAILPKREFAPLRRAQGGSVARQPESWGGI